MMLLLFLGVYAVLAVLVYLTFKVIKNYLSKIRKKSIYTEERKIQEFNEVLVEDDKKKNIIDRVIRNKKVEIQNIKNDMSNTFDDFAINLFEKVESKNKSIFEIDKVIDNNFTYDKEKIIKEFIERTDNSKNFNFCKRLERKFTFEKIYELSTISCYEVESELKKMLSDEEYGILELYKNTHEKFTLNGFLNYIDELVNLNDPTIIVYVGNKNENYEYLNKNIKTKFDKNIYRGIKIGYRGRMYDFSIDGRNF